MSSHPLLQAIYGSHITELYLFSSDIDIVVLNSHLSQSTSQSKSQSRSHNGVLDDVTDDGAIYRLADVLEALGESEVGERGGEV